jgi:hypothetical protein
MRVNVPVHTLRCCDPRGKHLKTLRGIKTLSARASQVGDGITIRMEGFEMALVPQDALDLISVIKSALDDNTNVAHSGEVIW